MNQEKYSLSDLDSRLSKDSITEDDLLQLPQLFPGEPKTFLTKPPSLTSYRTSPSHQLTNIQSL